LKLRLLEIAFLVSGKALLPGGADPCGERGEFHTFCYGSPEFRSKIPVAVGEIVQRDGFWFADLCSPTQSRCIRFNSAVMAAQSQI
jgi:hypothetical protein